MRKGLMTLALLTSMAPVCIMAEDTIVTSPTSETIALTANKTSAYTVTLPKSVDISANETTFAVKVKGDISSSETITVSMSDTVLSESVRTSGVKHEDVPVTVAFGDGKSKSYKAVDIKEENVTNATLTHGDLAAGNWTGVLTVNIAVS